MSSFLVIVAILLIYACVKLAGNKGKQRRGKSAPKSDRVSLAAHHAWLEERWAVAARQRGATGGIFAAWYFEPMTERQASYLSDNGQQFSKNMTKGQASDLIGLKELADEDDLAVLSHFKHATRGMN